MYAIVKTGGKQYRVEQGQSLLVERLPVAEGETLPLPTLLFVDGDEMVDGDGLAAVTVEARVVAHERGPKLRIVKFKPKRGYKRRTGHRQELTRLEITSLGKQKAARGSRSRAAAKPPAATATEAPAATDTEAPGATATEAPGATATEAPGATATEAPAAPQGAGTTTSEASNGA
jgi:large subunit ribosomal protein L21